MTTEEPFIDFKCPSCGEAVSFREDRAGMPDECPLCNDSLIVPNDGSEIGGAIPIPFSTPRLVLRRLRDEDWKDLLDLFVSDFPSDSEADIEERRTNEESRINEWLKKDRTIRLTTPNEAFYLAMEHQDEKRTIGYLCLWYNPDEQHCDLRAHVHPKYRRQGFATEAMSGALDFCFNGISIRRVTACCNNTDAACLRMLEKVSFRKEGVFLQERWDGQQWFDNAYHALLSNEYGSPESP